MQDLFETAFVILGRNICRVGSAPVESLDRLHETEKPLLEKGVAVVDRSEVQIEQRSQ